MFPETIETDSLVLARFCRDRVTVFDLYERFAEDRDGVSAVFEYVTQEPYGSVKAARDQLVDAEESWEEAESAQYAVYTRDEHLAGYTGLFLEWDRRTGRLGCTLSDEFWGRGYAGECAMALTDLAFDRLDLEVVAIGHEEGNDRSKRAIETFVESAGGSYDGVLKNWVPLGEEVADHHRYTVTQEAYSRSGP